MMSAARENSALTTNADGSTLEVSAFLHKPFLLEKLLSVISGFIGDGEPPGAERD